MNIDIFNTNRLLWHGDKLKQWQEGQNPYPILMDIHLTDACNLRCPRCAGGKRKGYLATDLAYDLLRQLRKGDVRSIVYAGGGEPTMHRDFGKIVSYTKELGFSVGLITNGSLLTDEMMETLVDCNAWVKISLDSYNEDTYNRNYGVTGNTFQVVCKNIARLVAIKNELGTTCTIGVGYMIDNAVIPGMMAATERVRSYGVDYIQFRHFETYPSILETKGIVDFDYSKFAQNLEECLTLETSNFRVTYPKDKFQGISTASRRPPDYSRCHASQFKGAIAATGDVYICCMLKGDPKFSFGRLGENSFHEIWNGRRRKEIMENLRIARDCTLFCRCHSMNSFLEPLTSEVLHVDFL